MDRELQIELADLKRQLVTITAENIASKCELAAAKQRTVMLEHMCSTLYDMIMDKAPLGTCVEAKP